MDAGFWHERWETHRIGFHSAEVNGWLMRYWAQLGIEGEATVLVPLCGKSLDMLWLHEQGYHVIGVEVSRIAAEAFFVENGINPVITRSGRFTRWRHDRLELLCGDFFDLECSAVGPVAAIYDRAALIALPVTMRPLYAAKIAELARIDTRCLLMTLEYNQSEMAGPPFSVSLDEVSRLFGAHCDIESLATADVLAANPRFRERGLSELRERACRLIFR